MTVTLPFGDTGIQLHAAKCIWIPAQRVLCVSDLHLEKGTFFSQFATFLPPYDSAETLERIAALMHELKPAIVIALGDSFHDKHAGSRFEEALKQRLNALVASVDRWIWITGNHDPEIDITIHGERREETTFANITFRHQLDPLDHGYEVSGHFHPKAKVLVRGHAISSPCFVASGRRLIIPSFGSFTGGLSIASRDFTAALPEPVTQFYLTHRGMVHALPGHCLVNV
jgi:DNA ligase-associated metallophosphoesterase